MKEALAGISLDDEVVRALLNHDGALTDIVDCAINHDQACFQRVHVDGLDAGTIRSSYLETVAWTVQASLDADSIQ